MFRVFYVQTFRNFTIQKFDSLTISPYNGGNFEQGKRSERIKGSFAFAAKNASLATSCYPHISRGEKPLSFAQKLLGENGVAAIPIRAWVGGQRLLTQGMNLPPPVVRSLAHNDQGTYDNPTITTLHEPS
jgi:hypothetical protein